MPTTGRNRQCGRHTSRGNGRRNQFVVQELKVQKSFWSNLCRFGTQLLKIAYRTTLGLSASAGGAQRAVCLWCSLFMHTRVVHRSERGIARESEPSAALSSACDSATKPWPN